MQHKFIFTCTAIFLAFLSTKTLAQDDIYPAKKDSGKTYIINGTVHTGDGKIIEKATVVIENGKIIDVGTNININQGDGKIMDASGKQIYPGLILPDTDLGLKEIGSAVPGSDDYDELGIYNSDIRSIVAYDATSAIIGTLRANGILLASVSPEGGVISGLSSVVQLDAWNWEDASYKVDNALHLYMPSFSNVRSGRRAFMLSGMSGEGQIDQVSESLKELNNIKIFFRSTESYFNESNPVQHNIKFEAIRGLFSGKQKLFVHASSTKQILAAIDLKKEFGFPVVIVGGEESWKIANLLKQNNIAVILKEEHSLPQTEDEDVDQPYKTPYLLQQAGVLFALNDTHEETRYRNLPFNAGTAVAYGLTKEQAIQALTLNSAKILGIDSLTGSIEKGKDANIVISNGDILDPMTSTIVKAFIQGRDVSLQNKQTQLYDRYMYKYGLKKE